MHQSLLVGVVVDFSVFGHVIDKITKDFGAVCRSHTRSLQQLTHALCPIDTQDPIACSINPQSQTVSSPVLLIGISPVSRNLQTALSASIIYAVAKWDLPINKIIDISSTCPQVHYILMCFFCDERLANSLYREVPPSNFTTVGTLSTRVTLQKKTFAKSSADVPPMYHPGNQAHCCIAFNVTSCTLTRRVQTPQV